MKTNRFPLALFPITLLVAIVYLVVNLLVDLSYAWFDPRIRLGEEASA